MTDEKRPYRKTRRAEHEEQTRRRITESAVALHGTLGPARTSISALAEHAGVRRSTVYRHFPDEAALFAACSAHWLAHNPLPDPGRWLAIDDADERVRTALDELYAFYRQTAGMMENILRDEPLVPVVTKMLDGYRGYLTAAREVLMTGRPPDPSVAAAIGHGLTFTTWRSLAVEQGLDDRRAASLMARLAAVVAAAV